MAPGKRLAWNEYGDPGGHPVMYYHGWPSSRLQARLAHHLALERSLRIIAMDRPGMGASTYEPGRTLRSWPDLIASFANSLGIRKFGQLGVSGGGPYVLACAAGIPERLTGSAVLAGAVLLRTVDSGLRGLHPAYRMMIPFRRLPSACFGVLFRGAAVATRLRPESPPLSWLLRTIDKDDRKILGDPTVWAAVTGSFRDGVLAGGGRGVMTEADIYFQQPGWDLATVPHPIRYWHGGGDRNIPLSMVREFTGKIRGTVLEEDPSLGHFSLVLRKAPAALDYLAGLATKSGD